MCLISLIEWMESIWFLVVFVSHFFMTIDTVATNISLQVWLESRLQSSWAVLEEELEESVQSQCQVGLVGRLADFATETNRRADDKLVRLTQVLDTVPEPWWVDEDISRVQDSGVAGELAPPWRWWSVLADLGQSVGREAVDVDGRPQVASLSGRNEPPLLLASNLTETTEETENSKRLNRARVKDL